MEVPDLFDSALLVPIDRRRGFWGTVSGASGTPPRVVALAVQPNGTLIIANIVGYQTACSAHFARLWMGEPLQFVPDQAVDWAGPTSLQRDTQTTYREHWRLQANSHHVGVGTATKNLVGNLTRYAYRRLRGRR